MKLWLVIAFFVIVTAYPIKGMAHGVKGKVASGGIVVIAEYTTGDPMNYAKVVITAPDKQIPFQIGRTDRNGRFCFFPDTPGQWKVVVSDEMGHRLEISVPVSRAMKLQSTGQKEKALFVGMSIFQRILMGLSIIFGLTGILLWWRAKRPITK